MRVINWLKNYAQEHLAECILMAALLSGMFSFVAGFKHGMIIMKGKTRKYPICDPIIVRDCIKSSCKDVQAEICHDYLGHP